MGLVYGPYGPFFPLFFRHVGKYKLDWSTIYMEIKDYILFKLDLGRKCFQFTYYCQNNVIILEAGYIANNSSNTLLLTGYIDIPYSNRVTCNYWPNSSCTILYVLLLWCLLVYQSDIMIAVLSQVS